MDEIKSWLAGRLPDDWYEGEPEVVADREEITIVGTLPRPEDGGAMAESGRIARWREETRPARIRIAEEAEARFGRKVAWGASCGESREMFTSLAAPVMTRLRQPERRVLDTLVDAGVARSRAHALTWCVRLVGEHTEEWLTALRSALGDVERLREDGPAT